MLVGPENGMSDDYWLGVDLGGTKILAGLFDDEMKLVTRAKHPTGSENGPEGVFERISEAVESVIREANIEPERIRGMGFGVPGQIQPNSSNVIYAPNLEWRDIDVGPLLPETWTWPIYLENDVRMGTYGEFSHGVAVGAKHVFGIFAGTGVGGAFILNGEVYVASMATRARSAIRFYSGRTARNSKTSRDVVINSNVPRRFLSDSPKRIRKTWKRIDFQRMKSSQLAELYHSGDPVAGQIVNEAARAIAAAIASVINLMSPEVIVLGGGVAGALGDEFQS